MNPFIQIANDWFKSLFRAVWDTWQGRNPIRVHLFIRKTSADRSHVFHVEIINHTKDRPVYVHAVRVHYGDWFYKHGFILLPKNTVEIKPAAKSNFFISYNNAETEIQKVILTKDPKIANAVTKRPTFESGASLFLAIANGNKKDSWIEIDFNEFKGRKFCRGQIKRMFMSIIAKGHQERGMTVESNQD